LQGETKTTGVLFLYTDPDPIVDDQRISLLLEIGTLFSNSIMRHSVIRRYQTATLEAQTASIAKSEFLANMSHEIRTPMNGVLGMLKLLQASELSAKQHHQANLARSSAEALLSLINDILDFSKIEAGKLELENIDFDIRRMIGDMSESMALLAQEKGLELILDLSEITLSHVKGDPGRLRQLLVNIIGNAIKFTEQGEITICLSLRDADENGMILYGSVSDTGIGIPPDKFESLFDSFSQIDASTTRHFGGTGLGLSICKRLTELMGGGLTVGSTLGEGSCFDFTLTLQHSEHAVPVMPGVDLTNHHILVVDDNTGNCEVLCKQLQTWNAHVSGARDASQALTIMEQKVGQPFSVAFIDMQMPGIAGPALGQAIRAKSQYDKTRLVMMTPMGELGDANFFNSLGFDDYFPKPATTADLCGALLAVLGDKQAGNTNPSTIDHQPEQKGTLRILLVEDNEINQQVALGVLEILGYSADIAKHGLKAIEMLSNAPFDNPYSVILMDCQMPVMDGYTATGEIRAGTAGERYQTIPIIAMTANAMLGDKQKCLDAGMDDYLSKPVDPDKIEIMLQGYQAKPGSGKPGEDHPKSDAKPPINAPQISSTTTTIDVDTDTNVTWDKADALKRVRGKEKFLAALVDLFLSEMPPRIKELQQAVEELDFDTTRSVAHAIKGVAGNLSGITLARLAMEMEKNSGDNQTEQIKALLPQLIDEYEHLTETFRSYLKNEN
ncbi:MAG: response regulator, partial [Pseudomonadales bacterium]|nr:response regulator [Pseudomonadales bacterium]